MSVASRNPFALLNEDDMGETGPAVPAPSPAPASPAPKAAPKDQKARSGPASRGGRYYQRGGVAKSVPKETQDNEAESTPRENKKFEGEGRGRGRGGRGARGRGAGGRGRQFDRHSGTLPDTEKRVNQGWGANEGTAELTAEQQGDADAVKDASGDTAANWGLDSAVASNSWGANDTTTTTDTWAAAATPGENGEANSGAANGAAADTRRPERKEEEEDHTLTLDEYLAQKAKDEAAALPKIASVRKANEGADESLWKDAVPLARDKDQDNYFIGKTKAAPKARPKKEEKVHIEIDTHFERPTRGGRGRGGGRGSERGERGRGGGRGRGGFRGGPRESPPTQPDVNVADQSAFPSLS